MARRSRMSMLKRQREIKKAEKAARKRARRHGTREEGFVEPRPTIDASRLVGGASPGGDDAPDRDADSAASDPEAEGSTT